MSRHRRPATATRMPLLIRALMVLALLAAAIIPVTLVAAGRAQAVTCPCSIWASTATPANPAASDTAAVEVGVKFRSDQNGTISAIRFYKGSGNTGTHVGNLWTSSGTRLGSVTFTGETTTGWQQASFATPVAITADTTYVASYYAPNGRYAADNGFFASSGVDNAPLQALRDGVDGGNGVYRYGTGGGFPTNTWRSSNYWVDVVFTPTADTTPPTVTATSPANGSTGAATNTTVTATFSEAIQSGSAQVQLAAGATTVSGSTSYDAATRRVTFAPAAALQTSTAYTVTLSGAKDLAGNAMTTFTWSFTTGTSTGSGCPCTIWPDTATPGTANVDDPSAVELGVKFRASSNGYITGLRFYKGSSNTGTHVGTLWSSTGATLSTVTFSGETASGWQTATLPSPVAITANTTYVASYHTDVGFYSADNDGFTTAVTRGPLTALANGTNGGNGVYAYGGGAFPTNTYQASNYWVDVVFDTTANDTTAPTVTGRSPSPNVQGVPTTTTVSATFNEAVTASTVTMAVTGPSGAVTGSTSYDTATKTATFTPGAALANSTSYSVAVSGAKDAAGNTMTPVNWSFTTAAPPGPGPDQGHGGPVLVIKGGTSGSGFSSYTAEILRTEGLNEFATADIGAVTATTLNQYDVVILGSMALTSAQVSMFTTWVTGGGNLIAFRPDKQLAGLLKLASTTGTLAEGYLKVDTATEPGRGITDQTIQYHGTADRYTLNGARAVATLHSNATTATTNPAVTLATVGTSGGEAAAFTYDLPQSIVYTRQGNPAWAGQERDAQSPIRSDDLYFGGSSTDWVNLSKVAIPQADEQQRLLANLVQLVNRDRKPLPRFWYFPKSLKAVVIATGDDHGNNGTPGRFDQYIANSPAGCSVNDWTCLRFTSYLYPSTPLSNTQAIAYRAQGFELGVHPSSNCANFTPASLASNYSNYLAGFRSSWPGLPSPKTSRFHCIVYSDWASQPKTQLANGVRMDTNYYYWPGTWLQNRPGFMTGSGMPMRFADTNGAMLDIYQATTQMTDESGQTYPATPNTLLDNALGTLGYYGAFTANMHTDNATTFESDQLLTSATSRGVPIVSAEQMLTWVDGRNASSFADVAQSGNTLTFTVNVGTGANGLTAMVPTAGTGGTTLTGLTSGGSSVPFTKQTIKGLEYAVFSAASGSYAATYASGAASLTTTAALTTTTARLTAPGDSSDASLMPIVNVPEAPQTAVPAISAATVLSMPDGTAAFRWKTSVPSDSRVLLGTSPTALTMVGEDPAATVDHLVVMTKLDPRKTYYYRLQSTSDAGTGTEPASGSASFVSSAYGVADYTAAQLRIGERTGGAYLRQDALGEVSLAPEDGEEFATTQLPAGWQDSRLDAGGRRNITGGGVRLDGSQVSPTATFAPGRPLSFAARFDARSEQSAGWAVGGTSQPSAMFAVRNGRLVAATSPDGKTVNEVALPAGLVGAEHTYTIEWSAGSVTYLVDGRQVARAALSATSMCPVASDARTDAYPLVVDWLRVGKHSTSGTLTSRVMDARAMVTWDRATWQAQRPTGSGLTVSVRVGNRPKPDSSWSAWQTLSGSGAEVTGSSRYLQYRVTLTANGTVTPVLSSFAVTSDGTPPASPGEG